MREMDTVRAVVINGHTGHSVGGAQGPNARKDGTGHSARKKIQTCSYVSWRQVENLIAKHATKCRQVKEKTFIMH